MCTESRFEITFWCMDCEQDFSSDDIEMWLKLVDWYKQDFCRSANGEFLCLYCFINFKREELAYVLNQ